jgi:hypothetical protein
MLYN